MVHQVRAHGVVHAQLEGHLQLGAHAVGRADQDGVLPALQVKPVKRAKAADAAQHVAVEGLLRQILDAFLGAVAAGDVNAGVGVGHGFGFGFVWHGAGFLRMEFTPERQAGKVDSSRILSGVHVRYRNRACSSTLGRGQLSSRPQMR